MRSFVIGDIHGGARAIPQVLERAGVQAGDRLVFIGDYADGWSGAADVVTQLLALQEKYDCRFIRGNHDAWVLDWLQFGEENATWKSHGGIATMQSYKKLTAAERQRHTEFYAGLELFFIDEQNRLFVHAGFQNPVGPALNDIQTLTIERKFWKDALETRDDGRPYPLSGIYRNVFIGHTPTTNYDTTEVMHPHNIFNVDTGAGFKGPLTILDVDNYQYWQSDPLPSLYPGEKGRNKS